MSGQLRGGNQAKRLKMDDEDWRISASNFSELLLNMYFKNIATDMILKVGLGDSSKEIECHSVVLAGQSPVFETMLSGRWTNQLEPKRSLNFPEDNPEHFGAFVILLYKDWKEEDFLHYESNIFRPELTVGIFALAHKYLAYQVIRRAEHFIDVLLLGNKPKDTVELYTLLKRLPICDEVHRARKTLRTVENCVLGDAINIFSSQAILNFRNSELAHIVRQQDLHSPEKLIYKGCIQWAQEECISRRLDPVGENLRVVLGEIIHLIRFPFIDNVTLTDEVVPSSILTAEEVTDLMMFKLNKNCQHLKIKNLAFPILKRTKPTKFRLRRLDLGIISKDLMDFSTPHGFEITASQTMRLSSIWLFGGNGNDLLFELEYQRNQELVHYVNKESSERGLVCVKLIPPWIIPRSTSVTIKFTITGGSTYVANEDIADETKEISIWNKSTIIFTFKRPMGLANGLNQLPLLEFSL